MEKLSNPNQAMPNERGDIIAKFGRFIKDVPFMETSSTETTLMTDAQAFTSKISSNLNNSDTLIMLDEHKFLLANTEGYDGGPHVQFERISARSGQNSRHGVFFGTIFNDKYAQDVAVKVFNQEQGGAVSMVEEVVKTSMIGKSGLKTFSPVGFGAYGQVYYSFWELEKQVTTLDSIDWAYFIDDISGNPGMVSIFEKTANTAAHIHANGWTHADFHPRNLAVDVTGSVFAIDWETANLDQVLIDDPESRYQKAYLDLSSFMTGCYYGPEHFNAGIGIFESVSNDEARTIFDRLFMDHYIKYRNTYSNDERELQDMPQLIHDLRELPDIIR